jgi:hypothetical protein
MLDDVWAEWQRAGRDVYFMPQRSLSAHVDKNASVMKKGRQSRSEENQVEGKVHFPAIGKIKVFFFVTDRR